MQENWIMDVQWKENVGLKNRKEKWKNLMEENEGINKDNSKSKIWRKMWTIFQWAISRCNSFFA